MHYQRIKQQSTINVTYLNMHLKRHRPHVRMKVEERRGTAAKPLWDVLGIGQRRAQSNDANGLSDLRWYVPHPWTDNLHHRLHNAHTHLPTAWWHVYGTGVAQHLVLIFDKVQLPYCLQSLIIVKITDTKINLHTRLQNIRAVKYKGFTVWVPVTWTINISSHHLNVLPTHLQCTTRSNSRLRHHRWDAAHQQQTSWSSVHSSSASSVETARPTSQACSQLCCPGHTDTHSGVADNRIGLCSVLRPLQHSISYMGDGFYRSKDPTNSIKVLKENLQNTNQTTETTQNTDIDIQ